MSPRPKRATLNPRECRIAHEALWRLAGSDREFMTDEVTDLSEKLRRYASDRDEYLEEQDAREQGNFRTWR